MLQIIKPIFAKAAPKDLLAARRGYDGPVLFSYGFRPFFLFGALWAAFSAPFWVFAYTSGIGVIGGMTAQEWHVHEMLFGYLVAIIAGFLLTAIPNWTGRLPVLGGRLMALFGLWVAGRIAMLVYGVIGPLPAAVIDCMFLAALAAMAWREVLAGKNFKNAPICVMATLLALSNIGFHLGALNYELHEISEHLAISIIALMIALIGGRVTPSFTRNWLKRRGKEKAPAPFGLIDKAALATAGVALLAWTVELADAATGWLMLAAGVLHAVRLGRWRGWETAAEPLVLILHIGYAWLPVSFLLMGASALAPAVIQPYAAMHALTAGAMGTMTLAVMTRATLGHTGRELIADGWTVGIYLLVISGAALRVLASTMLVEFYALALAASAFFWSGAFALFAVRYGPMLLRARA